jgi:broad specificity phosphatase PhoE
MSSGASSWREILNPTKSLTKLTEAPHATPFVGIVSSFAGNENSRIAPEAKSDSQETADETDKSLNALQTNALRFLSLAGCRIIREDSEIQIGIWEDLDGPEIREAIRAVGLDVHPIVYLESAEVPIRFKKRRTPERAKGESFAAWLKRAEEALQSVVAAYEEA